MSATPRGPYRVLVIDDNPAIHQDFQKILSTSSEASANLRELQAAVFGEETPSAPLACDFRVDSASQGQEGLELVRRAKAEGRPYALAFVDGRMPPGWDGIESIAHLWKEQPDLQVVLCTAFSDHSWNDIRRALGETDALVILKKPFDNVEAIQLAHALTKKWELNHQVQTRLADLDRLVRERTGQLQEALALFEASIAQSPLGILISEAPGGVIRWANGAALSMLGEAADLAPVGDERRRTIHDWPMHRPDGSPCPLDDLPLAKAIQRGEPTRNQDLLIRRIDGGECWTSVNAAPIRNATGAIVAGIAILQDQTQRREAEREKEELRAQFAHAQKMESIGRLAGGVAHDVNNMLQVITGYVELASRNADAGSVLQDQLAEIGKAAQRSAELTRQLLAFARRQAIRPRPINLNDAIASTLKMLERLIGEDIQLSWSAGQDLWPVMIDPSQIDQILANLAVNARDAITSSGEVTIETANAVVDPAFAQRHAGAAPGDYVTFSVADTGCGMSPEILSHIFEPFFTTKGLGKGTGLGLATVFGIVQQNQGFITVATQAGCGTTFRIYLPRCSASPDSGAEKIRRSPVRGTETILLVEDEPQVLNLGRSVLTQHGYTVLAASNPEIALALARQHPVKIHLLVTDVVMPGMNGKELYQLLQTTRPELRCLFISGYTADVIAQHGVINVDVQFLQKPFKIERLVEKVRDVLELDLGSRA